MTLAKLLAGSAAAGAMVLAGFAPAFAAGVVVVTPTNTQGWSTVDTRPGGAVNYVFDASSPTLLARFN